MSHESLKLPLIDTHSHLTFPEFDNDREETLQRAWDAGLESVVVIGAGAGIEGNRRAVEFAGKHKNVYATIGIHPHDAEKVNIDKAVRELRELALNEKVVAIGEIGLDYYREHSSKESQRDCFRRLIKLAYELKLPITIHDRDTRGDVIFTLREARFELTGGILHCFSGDVDVAKEVIELGLYIAIPGIVTFKKASVLRRVVKEIPIEHFVIETDCPYLAPEPYRGKRNEPAYTTYIASEIANLKGLSPEDVARITTLNARRAYNLPGLIPEGKIVYAIRKSLYINLTNRCTLACTFCPKRSSNFEVKGHNLKLDREPDVEDVFKAIGGMEGYDEVVFCGFGEPTLRLEILKVIARKLKSQGMRVRLDTDGLASLIHGRDVLPELAGLIDSVSVSMNAPDSEAYINLCPSYYGEEAFGAMVSFLKRAKEIIPEVTATAVAVPGLDIEACRKLTSNLGITFRPREYQKLG